MADEGRARQAGMPRLNVQKDAVTRRSGRVASPADRRELRRAVGSMEAIMENVPWNKGRLTGQKRPLKPKDVWAIRVRLQLQRRKRDVAVWAEAVRAQLEAALAALSAVTAIARDEPSLCTELRPMRHTGLFAG